ncbi:hypothetical protein HAZT_HAZT003070 [Hyalella azteca]|uniref:Uncharacterized protein n=1 Tax=Hyalella azteca TaxID=294128 RepID=A0A6A0H5P0_HYAAZ|nr:hypothetical protein HAZT_HAZT003070 [Hyalella azteca]
MLCSTNPSSPNIANMTSQINGLTNNLKTNRQKEYLDTFSRHTNIKRLWTTINALNRKPKLYSNVAIAFNEKPLNCNKKMANKFN